MRMLRCPGGAWRRALHRQAARASFDVVVVGGGVAGVATAAELAGRGQRVMLLERDTLTSGTTWHAAGLLTHLKGDPVVAELARRGYAYYEELSEATGHQIGFHRTGSLAVARSVDTATKALMAAQVGQYCGHRHEVLRDFADASQLHPFLSNAAEDFVLGVYTPEDGIVNPADCTMALAKRARQAGVVICEREPALGLTVSADGRKVVGVKTASHGEVACGAVVLAAGAWGRAFCLQELNVALPLGPAPHQYIITEKVAGVSNALPVLRDFCGRYYVKPEVGRLMVGVFEASPLPHVPDAVLARGREGWYPSDASHEVYEASVDKAGVHLEAAMAGVPALAETGLATFLHGPDTHAGDHGFVLGPLAAHPNVFVAGGFNSQGIQTAPGVGAALTDWILEGYPAFGEHFQNHAVSRANPAAFASHDYATYRALESYADTYAVVRPRQGAEACLGLAGKLPAHAAHLSRGAVFGDQYAWLRPLYYPDPGAEGCRTETSAWQQNTPGGTVPIPPPEAWSFAYKDAAWFPYERREALRCREAAAVFDMTPFAKVAVRGGGAVDVVNAAVTADVGALPVGGVAFTAFLHPSTGGCLGDCTVYRRAEEEVLCILPAADGHVFSDLLHHARAAVAAAGLPADAAAANTTDATAVFAVAGPHARRVMAAAAPARAWDDAGCPHMTGVKADVAGVACDVLRVSFTGEMAWEVHAPAARAGVVYEELFAAAGRAGVGLVPGGTFALLHSLRMEKGYHLGAELTPDVTPYEAGLGFAVNLGKPYPFVGQRALEAKKAAGRHLSKRFCSFVFEDGAASPAGSYAEHVYRNGARVGRLTSGGYSHTLNAPLALGYVDLAGKPRGVSVKAFIEDPGAVYEVEVVEGGEVVRRACRAVVGAVVDPTGRRMAGTE